MAEKRKQLCSGRPRPRRTPRRRLPAPWSPPVRSRRARGVAAAVARLRGARFAAPPVAAAPTGATAAPVRRRAVARAWVARRCCPARLAAVKLGAEPRSSLLFNLRAPVPAAGMCCDGLTRAPRAPDAHAARSAGRLRPLPHLLRRPQVRCARAGHRSPRRDAQSLADSACCAETLVQGNALARARAEQSHALPGRAASAVAASLFAPPPMAQPPLPGLPTRALSSSALPVPPPVQPPPGCDLAASTLLLPKAVFGAAADEMLLRYVFQPSLCSCCAYLTHRATGPRRCRRPCSRAAPPSRRRARASGQNGASSNLRRHASCFCLL